MGINVPPNDDDDDDDDMIKGISNSVSGDKIQKDKTYIICIGYIGTSLCGVVSRRILPFLFLLII